MTWFMVDDGVYDAPQTEDVPLAALGLWVKAGSYVGRQMRDKDYDGTFDMRRLRKLGGTPRLVAECVAAGLFVQTDTGVYAIVQAANLCKFAGGADLSGKRSEAGRKGGKASGRARRSKAEANATAPHDVDGEASASSKTEANASRLLEAKGTIPNLSDPLTSPDPSGPGSKQTVSIAEIEARAMLDPFATAWSLYPKHTGSPDRARIAWQAVTDGTAVTSQATPEALLAAVERYQKAVRDGDADDRFVKGMGRWLEEGGYLDWLPKPAKPRYTWGICDEQWLQEHILSQVPEGSFEGSIVGTFWANVKAGGDPEQAAERVVKELTRKGRPS
ncbi:hypothetical protein [Bifidobacterium simiiventris]|uniref:hypothetical protein n=1 Tax=Bifidobacterium simiiventris TaxID=2834434 RepID=UPI001C59B5E0|nr:hypothetical protein [Bifidobacterium simiiventris]MBW3077718.1 hypothetical protein [Bifidobacterium simiiventris]